MARPMSTAGAAPCACGGECCCTVPVTAEEAERIIAVAGGSFDDYFVTTNAGTFTRGKRIPSPPEVIVSRCCCFDPVTRLCTVYEVRPRICREHECHA